MGGATVRSVCVVAGRHATSSPARVREQRVLAPLGHVAVVIAVMVHSLSGVVGGQVVGRWVLGGARPAPLAQRLLSTVWAVDVVANYSWLGGRGHGHVEDVVLWPGGGLVL